MSGTHLFYSTVNYVYLLSFKCIWMYFPSTSSSFRSMFGFYSVWYFVDQGFPVVQKITFQTIQWAKRIPQSIQKSLVFPLTLFSIYGKYFLAQPETAIFSQPLIGFTFFLQMYKDYCNFLMHVGNKCQFNNSRNNLDDLNHKVVSHL